MVDYTSHWKSFYNTDTFDYQVSVLGKLRKIRKRDNEIMDMLTINFDRNMFKYVSFYSNDEDCNEKRFFIDEIVADLFLLDKPNMTDLYVIHKNKNLLDNEANNLDFVTIEYARANDMPMRDRPILIIPTKTKITLQPRFVEDCEEIWKRHSIYEVSNFGNVRDRRTKKLITEFNVIKGYLTITGLGQTYIHKLVGELFIECNIDSEYKMVVHKDGNKFNNFFGNLIWVNRNDLYNETKKAFREKHKQEKKPAMTNAERQRKFREKRKQLSKSLEN